MKCLLLLLAAGVVGACTHRVNQDQLQLRLLDDALQQANIRAVRANAATLDELHHATRHLRFGDSSQRQALAQLLTRSDSLVEQAEALVKLLETDRQRLDVNSASPADARSATSPDETRLGLGKPIGQAIAQVLAYRASLRQADSNLKLPQLSPQLGADTTVAALTTAYFGQGSKAQVAASLTQLEAQVLTDAAAALQAQSTRLVIEDAVFDEYGAFASAASNTVKVGDTYRAELFLARALKLTQPVQMTVNGRPLSVNIDGRGQVNFKVDSAQLGQRQQITTCWVGTIRTKYFRQDTIFKVKVPYTITR